MGVCSSKSKKTDITQSQPETTKPIEISNKAIEVIQSPQPPLESVKEVQEESKPTATARKLKRAASIKQNLVLMNKPFTKQYSVLPPKSQRKQNDIPFVFDVQNNVTGMIKYAYVFPKQDAQTALIVKGLKTTNLSHPYIVHFYELFEDQTQQCQLITESCKGGSLQELINSQDPIPQTKLKQIFKQAVMAINYLHELNLTHGFISLKAFHFLEVEQQTLKLVEIDKIFSVGIKITNNQLPILPPEEVDNEGRTKQRDCWALGILLHYLIFKRYPLNEYKSVSQTKKTYEEKDYLQIKDLEPNLQAVLRGLLLFEKNIRKNLKEILEEPWFKEEQKVETFTEIPKLDEVGKDMTPLQQQVLLFMIDQFEGPRKQQIFEGFQLLDVNLDGYIDHQDIKAHFSQFTKDHKDVVRQAKKLMDQLGLDDQHNKINFDDYLIMIIDKKLILTDDRLDQTFKILANGRPKLGPEHIEQRFSSLKQDEVEKELLSIIFTTSKQIQYHHFKEYMQRIL